MPGDDLEAFTERAHDQRVRWVEAAFVPDLRDNPVDHLLTDEQPRVVKKAGAAVQSSASAA